MQILERALKQELNLADGPASPEAVARAALNRLGWEQTTPAVQMAMQQLATLRPRKCSGCQSPLEEWEQSQCERCAGESISQNRKKV